MAACAPFGPLPNTRQGGHATGVAAPVLCWLIHSLYRTGAATAAITDDTVWTGYGLKHSPDVSPPAPAGGPYPRAARLAGQCASLRTAELKAVMQGTQ
jgi:hypothetical protein